MVGPTPTAPQTYLQIIEACDNFRLPSPSDSISERIVPWRLSPDPNAPAIGLLRPAIVEQLRQENIRRPQVPAWDIREDAVSFAGFLRTAAERTIIMREMCMRWRDEGLFPNVIGPKKWRGEMYPVYRNPFGKHDAPTEEQEEEEVGEAADDGPPLRTDEEDGRNYAFMMERAACALFGVVTYGVHLTIYEDDASANGSASSCKIWVPTRSRTKQTWPGYLDNSVAGGIPSGLGAFESLVKEAMEEASIEGRVVEKHAKQTGSVAYFFRTDAGWLQPEVQYIYDMRIPPGADPEAFRPKPLDGEVESFELLPLSEVAVRMRTGLFKRNCALVLVDFMVRHGYLTTENEPNYLEIVSRLHGQFEYERW
ncbi:nudix hydrolase 20 [Obba rivulosa]|uniref:Nudix hydrolase 20 n=1 Tax=Obba rivulosa TaxID=1052685 RepID=A0A8E2DS31_9APHY|nr:nudix hydrolase 20 [Obba rivulosa]